MAVQAAGPISARSARSTSRSSNARDTGAATAADTLLAAHIPLCDAVARLLWPRAEVVLHDLRRDRIAHIANPFSGRRAGDPSLAGEVAAADLGAAGVVGPYEKRNFDGRRLKAVMSGIRDESGALVGIVCINLDIDALAAAAAHLQGLAAIVAETPRPPTLFTADWREQVNRTVGEFLVAHATTIETLSQADLARLLRRLDADGAFAIRTAAPYVAALLKVSRATLYARLAAARRDSPSEA